MSISSPHQAHTWPKSPAEWQKWTITLNLNNLGKNGQILKVFEPFIKPKKSAFGEKKSFDLFCPRSRPKCETTPQINFLYFSAVSGSYLGPGRSKWHTLKGQNHLLGVANAGKPLRRVQLHQGGLECFRKDHYFGEIARWREIFLVDLTVCRLQTC